MVVIYRAAGGVSLNGKEYVLDDEGEPMLFNNEDEALEFLYCRGVTDAELEDIGFEEVPE